MATKITDIETILTQAGLNYDRRSDTEIVTGFGGLTNYRNLDGEPLLTLVIQLSEHGRYFTLFAPRAYRVEGEHTSLFMQACVMVQWKTKLIQFEFDARDGEVRPVIEFPLEDAPLTSKQLLRCLSGMTELVDKHHLVLMRVLDQGILKFESEQARLDLLFSMLSHASGIEAPDSDSNKLSGVQDETRDLSGIEFVSSDHIRYEQGRNVSGNNPGCMRGVKIEDNIDGNEGYTVTIHNLDGPHPLWGNNIQMAPKQMRVIRTEGSEVEMRGFGTGRMGGSFSEYGLTLHFDGSEVQKAVLHMHDRNIDIEYLKGDPV